MKIKKVMGPKTTREISSFAVWIVCLMLIWTGAATAQQGNPLLIPGKQTLYQKVITHPVFLEGTCDTSFLDTHPEIFELPEKKDRANKILSFIGHTTVNGYPKSPGA